MQAHIVPRFHLGRFATPPGRRGFVYLIEKRTGRTERVRVDRTCTAEDFYIIEDDLWTERHLAVRVEDLGDVRERVERQV